MTTGVVGVDMWYKTWIEKLKSRIEIFKGCTNTCWVWIQGISIRVWKRVFSWLKTLLTAIKHVIKIIYEQRQFNGQMIKYGTLFLSSGLIFLGIKSTDTSISTGIMPAPPESWSSTLRAIASVTLFALIIAIFWILRKYGFVSYIKKRIKIKIVFFLVMGALILFALWLLPLIPVSDTSIINTSKVGISFCAISGIFGIAVFCKWLSIKLTEYIEISFSYLYWSIFLAVFVVGWWNGLANIFTTEASWPLFIGFFWFFIIVIQLFKSARQTRI